MDAVLAQYGIAGLLLSVMLGVGRILFMREIARGDRYENDLRQVNLLVQDKVIPVVIKATETMAAMTEFLSEQRRYANPPPQPQYQYYPPQQYQPQYPPPVGRVPAGALYDPPQMLPIVPDRGPRGRAHGSDDERY